MDRARQIRSSCFDDIAEKPLRLRLFGTFSLVIHGQEVPGVSRTGQELLAQLALRAEAPSARASLAALLWPNASPERGLFYLRRCLFELREALGEAKSRLIAPTRKTLAFDFSDVECDLITFDRCAYRKDIDSLERAITSYHGSLLNSSDTTWVLPERAHRQERYLELLTALADYRIESGDIAEAVHLLQRAVEADPLREATTRRLMQALGLQGDYVSVEKQFRQLRQCLRDALNMEPSAETATLRQDLHSQPKLTPAPSSETPSSLLGRRCLPSPLTSLIGRTRDLEAICAVLQTARLVTLTGPGGVGKTRLAIAVAETMAERYSHGVIFVDLAPASDYETLLKAVAAALGSRADSAFLPDEALRHFLVRKSLLLVLDNAEHILPACAKAVNFLIGQCPLLHVLCTSRESLHLSGEHVRQVLPLEIPPKQREEDTTRLLSYDAARLLTERAAAAADFQLTARNAAAITQICRRLDGIPLALELVAARFRSLSAQEIAANLDDYFRLLSSGDPSLSRHRTLYATIEWSYGLLDETERRLLRELSVFVGGWTLAAADAICLTHSEKVLPTLLSLIEKSLIVCEIKEEQTHYRLLEMTRAYVATCLLPEEQTSVSERHAAFFLSLLEESDADDTEEEKRERYKQVQANRDNLRSAYAWWKRQDEETALWMEYRLYQFGLEKPADWRSRIARLEAEPLSISPLSLLITFQTGSWAIWTGYAAGETLLLRAVEIGDACGEALLVMYALTVLAALEEERGNAAQTLAYAEAALVRARRYGNIYYIARSEMLVYATLARTGAREEARQFLQTQLERGRRENDWRILLPTLNALAELASAAHEWDRAYACWEEALPMARKLQPDGLPNQLRDLAYAAREKLDYETAWRLLEQGIVESRRNRSLDREAWVRWDMAEIAYRQGDTVLALNQLHLCLELFQDNEEARSVTRCLRKAAGFHLSVGRYEWAALLLGSVERRTREQALSLPSRETEAYQNLIAMVRANMGEEYWKIAVLRGQTLSFEEVEILAFVHD